MSFRRSMLLCASLLAALAVAVTVRAELTADHKKELSTLTTALNKVNGMVGKKQFDEAETLIKETEERVSRWAQTDGRPSWGFGAKAGAAGPRMPRRDPKDPNKRFSDPLHVFARYARSQARGPQPERVVPLHENDRQALEALGFQGRPKSDEIKQAYKRLVKLHHPDANGGSKSSEDRLRAIIAAYSHLKTKGFVAR